MKYACFLFGLLALMACGNGTRPDPAVEPMFISIETHRCMYGVCDQPLDFDAVPPFAKLEQRLEFQGATSLEAELSWPATGTCRQYNAEGDCYAGGVWGTYNVEGDTDEITVQLGGHDWYKLVYVLRLDRTPVADTLFVFTVSWDGVPVPDDQPAIGIW